MKILLALPNEIGTLTVDQRKLIAEVSVCDKVCLGDQTRILLMVNVFDPNALTLLFGVRLRLDSIQYKGVALPRTNHICWLQIPMKIQRKGLESMGFNQLVFAHFLFYGLHKFLL